MRSSLLLVSTSAADAAQPHFATVALSASSRVSAIAQVFRECERPSLADLAPTWLSAFPGCCATNPDPIPIA